MCCCNCHIKTQCCMIGMRILLQLCSTSLSFVIIVHIVAVYLWSIIISYYHTTIVYSLMIKLFTDFFLTCKYLFISQFQKPVRRYCVFLMLIWSFLISYHYLIIIPPNPSLSHFFSSLYWLRWLHIYTWLI